MSQCFVYPAQLIFPALSSINCQPHLIGRITNLIANTPRNHIIKSASSPPNERKSTKHSSSCQCLRVRESPIKPPRCASVCPLRWRAGNLKVHLLHTLYYSHKPLIHKFNLILCKWLLTKTSSIQFQCFYFRKHFFCFGIWARLLCTACNLNPKPRRKIHKNKIPMEIQI